MSTIKQQVLKEFPDAKYNYVEDMHQISSNGSVSRITDNEEEAWIAFYNEFCNPLPMNYKDLVLEKFPDAQVWKDVNGFMYIESSITSEHKKTATEAWESFYELHYKPLPQLPMNYKELVLEKFIDAKIVSTDHKWFVKVETNDFRNKEDAWKAFYEQYCTDKTDLIIGNEYEFSNDGVDWYVREFGGFMGVDFGGHEANYSHIRPIQNNPKLDQLKQLAEELDFNLVPKNK